MLIVYAITTSHPVLNIWPAPLGGVYPPLKHSLLALLFAILILRVFLHRDDPINRIWRWGWLRQAGLISYALYMYHQSVNGLFHGFLFRSEPLIASVPHLVTAVLVVATAIGLATLSFIYVERPIRRFGHRLSDRFSENKPVGLVALEGVSAKATP